MLQMALAGLPITAGLMFVARLVRLPLCNVAIVHAFWGKAEDRRSASGH